MVLKGGSNSLCRDDTCFLGVFTPLKHLQSILKTKKLRYGGREGSPADRHAPPRPAADRPKIKRMVAEKDIPNPDPNDRVRSGTGPDTRRVRSGYEIVYACGCGNEQDWVWW